MNRNMLAEMEPEIVPFLVDADHVDVKTIAAEMPMRSFIAGMLSYHPAWLKFLYAVRWGFVRLLGMKQEGMPLERQFHHLVVRQVMRASTHYQPTMADAAPHNG